MSDAPQPSSTPRSDAPRRPQPERAPEPQFVDHPVLDHLIAVTLELGAELWAQRERMRVIEKLLGERGVVTPEMIEGYHPSEQELETSRSERDAFVNRIYGAFARQTVPGARE